MIKTISAALLAVSVLAAPALAATGKSGEAGIVKATPVKAGVLNANAKMGRHHTKHYSHHSHRHHKKVAVTKATPKVGFKASAHTVKHG
jgi:hypothetical protein